MKKIIFTLTCILSGIASEGLIAQSAITPEVLNTLKTSEKDTPESRAIRNAMARTSIQVLAANVDALKDVDGHFTHRVPTIGITDQQSSGRCWLFTGLNVLRAKAQVKHELPKLELSQVYLFFYDQLEKSNLFLQGIIDTRKLPMEDRQVDWLFEHPLSDGGTFTGVSDLVMKYGVVPREVMPETFAANNTAALSARLKDKLREFGLTLREMSDQGKGTKELEQEKVKMLSTIYHILTLAYGVPPTEFTWTQRNKKDEAVSTETYTPLSFYQKYWDGEDLNENYIMVMNDPMRDYYKLYQIAYDRHTHDGHNWLYLNLPIEEIKPMAIASIKDTTAMYFSCDVGKFYDRTRGTLDLENFDYASLLGTDFKMDKRERVLTHASGSSHAMTLIAVDLDNDGTPKRWMVENSWGATSGYKGNLIMTDKWFDEYMFRLVFHKKYVPAKYLKMMEQKPILLPAWDPMFAEEE